MVRGQDCQERCYVEGVTYLARCRRCKERQVLEGVQEDDIVDECYIGESHRSVYTRSEAHFGIYKQGKGGVSNQPEEEEERDDEKAGSFMREHTLKCHGGVFSTNKMDDYEFLVINRHKKVFRRQLEEAILQDWAQGWGMIKQGKRTFRMNRNVLNSKFEHWRPRPVFIVGR